MAGAGTSPWQWFVPGIIVMVSLFGTSVAGSYLLEEMRIGSFERFLVTPLDRRSLLVGRALKEVVPLTLQALLIVAIVTPFGFQLHPAGIVVGLLILAVFGVGLGALSHSLAMSVRHQEYLFWLVQQTLLFPLLLLSGILLPMELAPDWLQGAVAAQSADLHRRGRAGAVRGRPREPVGGRRGGRGARRGRRRARAGHEADAARRRLIPTPAPRSSAVVPSWAAAHPCSRQAD